MTSANSTSIILSDFARDVLKGLNAFPKHISSKYFYDERGDKLFQDIMHMPEYYLTDCEFEILDHHKVSMLEIIGEEHFDLIELGAGDGLKTKILLEYFIEKKADFTYCPVDISGNVLQELEADVKSKWPTLDLKLMQGDYFDMLGKLHYRHHARKVILFLGSNIGNLTPEQAEDFIRRVQENMDSGDLLITGFDLKKDPEVILNAYSDPAGITAAFNLNLLRRMNEELGANFNLDHFKHWETYNPISGATKSYIISKVDQEVEIKSLHRTFSFQAWEAIDVELSQKFSVEEIEDLARATGFRVIKHFTDRRRYFVDSVWIK